MSRIIPAKVEQTTGKTRELLNGVNKALGTVPNLFKVLAVAPAVLEGHQAFARALKGGKLTAKDREQIALAVANHNNCNYCLAAHSALGQMVGLTESEIVCSVKGVSTDKRQAAILSFVKAVVEKRGQVSASEYQNLTDAGVTDEEALEVVAVVVENIFTNYINGVAETEVDFQLPISVKEATTKTACAH